jgi:hypothetical protein
MEAPHVLHHFSAKEQPLECGREQYLNHNVAHIQEDLVRWQDVNGQRTELRGVVRSEAEGGGTPLPFWGCSTSCSDEMTLLMAMCGEPVVIV